NHVPAAVNVENAVTALKLSAGTLPFGDSLRFYMAAGGDCFAVRSHQSMNTHHDMSEKGESRGGDEIVVFMSFRDTISANLVKSKLDAYGIPCFLTEENLSNLYPGASALMNSQVRLHLFTRDVEPARLILSES